MNQEDDFSVNPRVSPYPANGSQELLSVQSVKHSKSTKVSKSYLLKKKFHTKYSLRYRHISKGDGSTTVDSIIVVSNKEEVNVDEIIKEVVNTILEEAANEDEEPNVTPDVKAPVWSNQGYSCCLY